MKSLKTLLVFVLCLPSLVTAHAADADIEGKLASLKQALQQNKEKLKQYEWIETITVSKNGEQKSQRKNRCYYGADGKVQKVPISVTQSDD